MIDFIKIRELIRVGAEQRVGPDTVPAKLTYVGLNQFGQLHLGMVTGYERGHVVTVNIPADVLRVLSAAADVNQLDKKEDKR